MPWQTRPCESGADRVVSWQGRPCGGPPCQPTPAAGPCWFSSAKVRFHQRRQLRGRVRPRVKEVPEAPGKRGPAADPVDNPAPCRYARGMIPRDELAKDPRVAESFRWLDQGSPCTVASTCSMPPCGHQIPAALRLRRTSPESIRLGSSTSMICFTPSSCPTKKSGTWRHWCS